MNTELDSNEVLVMKGVSKTIATIFEGVRMMSATRETTKRQEKDRGKVCGLNLHFFAIARCWSTCPSTEDIGWVFILLRVPTLRITQNKTKHL